MFPGIRFLLCRSSCTWGRLTRYRAQSVGAWGNTAASVSRNTAEKRCSEECAVSRQKVTPEGRSEIRENMEKERMLSGMQVCVNKHGFTKNQLIPNLRLKSVSNCQMKGKCHVRLEGCDSQKREVEAFCHIRVLSLDYRIYMLVNLAKLLKECT